VAAGTPTDIARSPTHTGKCLRQLIRARATPPRSRRGR
jgi:hypothetical protein